MTTPTHTAHIENAASSGVAIGSGDAAGIMAGNMEPTPPASPNSQYINRQDSLQHQLMLIGVTADAATHAAGQRQTDPLTFILDSIDQPFFAPAVPPPASSSSSSVDAWTLFPGGYSVHTPRLADGWPRIRAFMNAYTEPSMAAEGSVDSFGRHTAGLYSAASMGMVGAEDATSGRPATAKRAAKSGTNTKDPSKSLKNVKDFNYHYIRAEHEPNTHRLDYGRWKDALITSVAREEVNHLYQTAHSHSHALAILYARRSVLILLHLLKDELADSTPVVSSRRLSVATLAAHSAAAKIGVPSSRVLHSPESTPAAAAVPPFLRRTASVAHALSSFGPAGFIARFIALLCSAPHQLSTSVGVDGRRTGLGKLSGVVGTILLAEKHRLGMESMRVIEEGRPITQVELKKHAPIARHLIQGACTHMMTLCKRDGIEPGTRHAIIHTVEYIFDAIFALEDTHSGVSGGGVAGGVSAARSSPRSNAAYELACDAPSQVAGSSMIMMALLSVPVCTLILEVIASACYALSPSGAHCIASGAGAGGLTDANGTLNALAASLERQRLFFVRLLARVLNVRTRLIHTTPSVVQAMTSTVAAQRWIDMLHARLATLQPLVLGALEDESLAGRGTLALNSFPFSFFLRAMVDLALVFTRYQQAWDTLEHHHSQSEQSSSSTSSTVSVGLSQLPVNPDPALSSPLLLPTPAMDVSSHSTAIPASDSSDSSPSIQAISVTIAPTPPQLSPAPTQSDAPPALDRKMIEQALLEKKALWFKQLVMLDVVLTSLRSRPKGSKPVGVTGAVMSGISISPPSPSSTPSATPPHASPNASRTTPTHQPSSASIGEDELSSPHMRTSASSSAIYATPRSDRSTAASPIPSPAPSPRRMAEPHTGGTQRHSAATRQENSIPLEFVDLFWDRTQISLIEAIKKEHATEKLRMMVHTHETSTACRSKLPFVSFRSIMLILSLSHPHPRPFLLCFLFSSAPLPRSVSPLIVTPSCRPPQPNGSVPHAHTAMQPVCQHATCARPYDPRHRVPTMILRSTSR